MSMADRRLTSTVTSAVGGQRVMPGPQTSQIPSVIMFRRSEGDKDDSGAVTFTVPNGVLATDKVVLTDYPVPKNEYNATLDGRRTQIHRVLSNGRVSSQNDTFTLHAGPATITLPIPLFADLHNFETSSLTIHTPSGPIFVNEAWQTAQGIVDLFDDVLTSQGITRDQHNVYKKNGHTVTAGLNNSQIGTVALGQTSAKNLFFRLASTSIQNEPKTKSSFVNALDQALRGPLTASEIESDDEETKVPVDDHNERYFSVDGNTIDLPTVSSNADELLSSIESHSAVTKVENGVIHFTHPPFEVSCDSNTAIVLGVQTSTTWLKSPFLSCKTVADEPIYSNYRSLYGGGVSASLLPSGAIKYEGVSRKLNVTAIEQPNPSFVQDNTCWISINEKPHALAAGDLVRIGETWGLVLFVSDNKAQILGHAVVQGLSGEMWIAPPRRLSIDSSCTEQSLSGTVMGLSDQTDVALPHTSFLLPSSFPDVCLVDFAVNDLSIVRTYAGSGARATGLVRVGTKPEPLTLSFGVAGVRPKYIKVKFSVPHAGSALPFEFSGLDWNITARFSHITNSPAPSRPTPVRLVS